MQLGVKLDQSLLVELLRPIVATAATDTFTYSRPWLRGLMAHFTEPRFAPALRNLTPPREYALAWRATLSAAGLFAQLGATVPTRGFHLVYSPGFRGAQRLLPPSGQAGRWAEAGVFHRAPWPRQRHGIRHGCRVHAAVAQCRFSRISQRASRERGIGHFRSA